jgi:hypothetical protein
VVVPMHRSIEGGSLGRRESICEGCWTTDLLSGKTYCNGNC